MKIFELKCITWLKQDVSFEPTTYNVKICKFFTYLYYLTIFNLFYKFICIPYTNNHR